MGGVHGFTIHSDRSVFHDGAFCRRDNHATEFVTWHIMETRRANLGPMPQKLFPYPPSDDALLPLF